LKRRISNGIKSRRRGRSKLKSLKSMKTWLIFLLKVMA